MKSATVAGTPLPPEQAEVALSEVEQNDRSALWNVFGHGILRSRTRQLGAFTLGLSFGACFLVVAFLFPDHARSLTIMVTAITLLCFVLYQLYVRASVRQMLRATEFQRVASSKIKIVDRED